MIDNILGNKTCIRVLRLLSKSVNKFFTIKEIQENTGLGFGNLFNAIKILEYNQVILKNDSKIKQYKLNVQHPLNDQLKNIFDEENKKFQNIDLPILKVISDFELEIIKELTDIKKVILFGSVARGAYDEKSDIDLAIIKDKKDNKDNLKLARKTKKDYKNIQTHFFTTKEFNKSKEPLITNIKKEGVILNKH